MAKGPFRGKTVIYEKVDFKPRPANQLLYSWDPEWEYRHTDVFPAFVAGRQAGLHGKAKNSSIVIMDPNGSNQQRIFDADTSGLDPSMVQRGMAGAFQPTWLPDGQWVAFLATAATAPEYMPGSSAASAEARGTAW